MQSNQFGNALVEIYGWQSAGNGLGTGCTNAGSGGWRRLAERWQLDAIWLAYANFQPRWLGDGCL